MTPTDRWLPISIWMTALYQHRRFNDHAAGTAILITAIGLAVALTASAWFFTVDDAYITYRYARNAASGLGPVFNPGQRVEGFTSPLWFALATCAETLRLPPEQVSKFVSIMAVAALIAVCARRLNGSPWWTRCLLLLPATHGPLLIAAVSGLETAVNACLIAALFLSAQSDVGAWRRPAVWGGLALLARPENAMLVGVHGLYLWFTRTAHRRSLARAAIGWFAVAAAMTAARWFYYGRLIPNTAVAKIASDAGAWLGGWHYVVHWASRHGWLLVFALPLFARPATRRIALHGGLLMLAQLAFVLVAGGDWMPGYRFMLPVAVLALTSVCVALGQQPADEPRASARAAIQRPLGIAIAAALCATTLVAAGFQLWSFRSERWAMDDYRRLMAALADGPVRYVGEHADSGDVVVARDVGLLGYRTQCRIVDLVGLTDPAIAATSGLRRRDRLDTNHVFAEAPDFILLQSERSGGGPPDYDRLSRPLMRHADFGHYALAARFALPGRHFCEIYERREEPTPIYTALGESPD